MPDLTLESLKGWSSSRSRADIAWAAGLFEGEGSFTYGTSPHGYRRAVAELGMTDRDPVLAFWSIVGVGNVTTHHKPSAKKRNDKPIHLWKTASFEGVQHTAAILWPWLHSRRRDKISYLLTSYHEWTNERRFTLASDAEVERVKQLLREGVGKRTIARLVGRSYGFVNHIKQGRTHGEAAHA